MKEIVITNEKQAFDLLEKAVKKELGDKAFTLKFERWPVLEIKLEGKGYDSTITADMAAALIEVQRAVNRTYARAVHNSANARTLKDDERQDIQFKAKVKRGSSVIEVNLGDFAEKLASMVTGKMTPEQLTITVLGIAIAGASLLAYKAFLKHRTEDKQIEQTERTKMVLSQEETKRLEIFGRAMKQEPVLVQVRDDFDNARVEIIRSTGDARTLTVNNIQLDNETTRIIGNTTRTESHEVQLNGTYTIHVADLRQQDEVKLRVQRTSDGLEFLASFKDQSLHQDQIKILQDAEWNRHPVYLSINARLLRGAVTVATVIEVKLQPATPPAPPAP